MSSKNKPLMIILRSDVPAFPGDNGSNFTNRVPPLRNLDGPFRMRLVGHYSTSVASDAPATIHCDLALQSGNVFDAQTGGPSPVIAAFQRFNAGQFIGGWIHCHGRATSDLVNVRVVNAANGDFGVGFTLVMIEIQPLLKE